MVSRESSAKDSGIATVSVRLARLAWRRDRRSFWAGRTVLLKRTSKNVTNKYMMFFERNFFPKFAKYKCKTYFQVYQSPKMNLKAIIYCAAILAAGFSCGLQRASAQDSGALGLRTVVIDPGHGGKDAGAISKDRKTYEKRLTLEISKLLKKKIEDLNPGVKVLMTREKDEVFVPLIDRAKFATNNNADFFISVHINSSEKTSPNGYSVHLLGPSTDKNKDTYAMNMDVVQRENSVILLEDDYSTTYQGFDPKDPESDIFLHLMTNAYREQSILFAQLVDKKLAGGPIRKSNGISQNNFAVLRLASMPAALLELGFISNPTDLEALRSSRNLDRIAQRLAEAFTEYKKLYDESVGAGKEAKPSQPDPAAEKVSAAPAPSSEVWYGTQVLATKKSMDPKDRYFLGYEPRCVSTPTLNKYVIGVSEDLGKAREDYRKIKAKYPDAFLVKVDDNGCTRVK
jgi:N-acetylmuramoyl-L-alanine amidase